MRWRGVRAAVAAVVAAAPLAAVTPAGAAQSPIHPDNEPTPVPGQENGRLPPKSLINVAPGCEAYRDAAPSVGLLLRTARHTGSTLGTGECYRPIDEQVAVRQQWTNRGNSACAAPVKRDAEGRPIGTSNHGWGKAGDFTDARGSLTFSSEGYAFLKATAGRFGWNHPGWAEPGGSACPEAWHWEWVGDGGTMGADPIRADVVALVPRAARRGYSGVSGLGDVAHRGGAADHGDAAELPLDWLMVDAAALPDAAGDGYWLTGLDGGVFAYGAARFHGSTGGMHLNESIVAMATTPAGGGYWLVAADGGVFAFGDARFHGSLGDVALQRPIVGVAATPSGRGYWLTASDGGVFAFGDAQYHGSRGAEPPPHPIVDIAATPEGTGYWLVAADGAVYPFGTARDFGSMAGEDLNLRVVAVAATPAADGYWLAAADGGVFAFGGARFHGRV